MKPIPRPRTDPCAISRRQTQAGLGLIELLVVIVISLLMLAGLFATVYGTRQSFVAQNQLAQLQDNERLAMTVLTNIIQTAGYFSNPTTSTLGAALPIATVNGGNFAAAGQSVYGISGDQIWVRYVAGTSDGVMDCSGQTNATAGPQTDVNTFYVASVGGVSQLVCQVTENGTTTTQPLVSGVTSMTILYGVDTNGDGSVDQYIPASTMAAANWKSVISVQVTLTFANPVTGATGVTGPATFQLTRTIDLMSQI